jgi:hypothetical protein
VSKRGSGGVGVGRGPPETRGTDDPMNADRRSDIRRVEHLLVALKDRAAEIKKEVTGIKDDEAGSKEALPENMQNGDRAQAIDTNVENLESAESEIG